MQQLLAELVLLIGVASIVTAAFLVGLALGLLVLGFALVIVAVVIWLAFPGQQGPTS